jgi:SAM-dependent methyltransferase
METGSFPRQIKGPCRILLTYTIYFIPCALLLAGAPIQASNCNQKYSQLEDLLWKVAWDHKKYNTRRGYLHYTGELGDRFERLMRQKAAQPSFHWLDAGGGKGNAAEEFLRMHPEGNSKATVVSLERLPTDLAEYRADLGKRYRHLSGTPLENLSASELGASDVITDLYGAFSYSPRPDRVLQKYCDTLKEGGTIFLRLPKTEGYQSFVQNKAKWLPMGEWLKQIPNLKVSRDARGSYLIQIQDHSKPVMIPELQLRKANENTPPERYFAEAPSEEQPFTELPPLTLKGQQFEINRSLDSYLETFSKRDRHAPQLEKSLQQLKPGQVWLDGGAGNAIALRQYLQEGGLARVIGVGYEAPLDPGYSKFIRTPEAGKFTYHSGRLFEQIPNQELGRVDLITDLVGIASYTKSLDVTLKKYLELLKPGGEAYIQLSETRTRLINKRGQPVSLVDYLQGIQGAEIDKMGEGIFRLRKKTDRVRVPALSIRPEKYDERTVPPLREFLVASPDK